MILAKSSVPSAITKELMGEFSLIKFVIKSYHSDKRVHIVFDHMFSSANFTVFMLSMRIGKKGIPLWVIRVKDNSSTFKLKVITEDIDYVSNLFGNNFDLIFFAVRWFNSTKLMSYINSLSYT